MSGTLSALLLLVAANSGDPMEDARKAYNNCIVDVIGEHLDRKASEKEFRNSTKTACEAERKTYVDIVTKDEMGYGSSKSEAAAYAEEEVQGIITSFVEGYGGYASTNAKPVKEN